MPSQIEQIQESWVLRVYGGMLALAHIVTAYFWYWRVPFLLDRKQTWPVCFPFFPKCEAVRLLSYDQLLVAMGLFGMAALIVAALFFTGKIRAAWWGLLFVVLCKLVFYIQEYRLIHNLHYMLFFAVVIYLFFPRKEDFLRVQLVLFYFAASLLKFNVEWLQGYDLIETPFIEGIPLRMALHWVVVLEFVLVWGLFSSIRWLRYSVLLQLVLFHLLSFHQVGYFYPVSMLLLISLFFLREWRGSVPQLSWNPAIALWAIAFMALQILPKVIPGDEALDGRKRMFSLFMFDAKAQCVSFILGEREREAIHLRMPPIFTEQRIVCDPIVFEEIGRRYCEWNRQEPKFDRISIFLSSRRASGLEWTTLIQEPDFCRRNRS